VSTHILRFFATSAFAAVLCCSNVCAQDSTADGSYTDSTFFENTPYADSVAAVESFAEDAEVDDVYILKSANDTSLVHTRSFARDKVDQLKDDADMNYEVPPTVAESLWDRFIMWVKDLLSDLFLRAVGTNWGRLFLYLLGLGLLVLLIMMLLRVDALRMLVSGQKARSRQMVLDEDIDRMDFEKLLQDAAAAKDYRRGIRLLFLYALKLLSDKNHVVLDSGKTNHDYLNEVKEKPLYGGFSDLNFYFEYAWYGNFLITSETFQKAQNTFNTWKNNLR
jgi:hypothetical protein